MLAIDIYRDSVNLHLPDGYDMYRTLCGSLLSLFTFALLGLYAMYKLMTLFNYLDYKVQEHKQLNYFEQMESFGANDGFAFAMGLIKYDGKSEPIEYPSIG